MLSTTQYVNVNVTKGKFISGELNDFKLTLTFFSPDMTTERAPELYDSNLFYIYHGEQKSVLKAIMLILNINLHNKISSATLRVCVANSCC